MNLDEITKSLKSGAEKHALQTACEKNNSLEAVAASICAMGVCGERAFDKIQKKHGGNSTYRNYIIDEIYNLDGKTLEECARYEIR